MTERKMEVCSVRGGSKQSESVQSGSMHKEKRVCTMEVCRVIGGSMQSGTGVSSN